MKIKLDNKTAHILSVCTETLTFEVFSKKTPKTRLSKFLKIEESRLRRDDCFKNESNAVFGVFLQRLLIDFQQGFDDIEFGGGNRNNMEAEKKAAKLLSIRREKGLPVFHTQHCSIKGEHFPAQLIHHTALASINGEFATVADLKDVFDAKYLISEIIFINLHLFLAVIKISVFLQVITHI